MKSRTVLLIVSILLVYVALTIFIGWNGFVFWTTAVTDQADWAFWTLYPFIAYGYLAAMLLRRVLPYGLYKLVKLIGSYGLAVLMYSLLTLPLADLLYVLLRWGGVDSARAIQGIGSAELLLLAGIILLGSRNAWSPVVRRYDIRVAKQAGARKELRLAVASDLHLGTIVGKRHIHRLLRRVEALKPDLILLPGDVLDDSIDPFIRERMDDVLRNLRAPLGVYASLGNHEYIGGHIDEYLKRMQAIGIEVLVDRIVSVDATFYVAGRKDAAVARFDPGGRLAIDELLAEADKSLPIVLLDHQPRQLGEAEKAGVDLMLSGHTHRGQLMPGHLITRRIFELDWGYLRKGAMHAIVSCGFGSWGPPLRIGSRSELLDIRIVFGDVE
ncbi:metallophosphoesterase [Paenibacillus ginsengarvi]|uniref:Metallophosphoesterase n=1 Tax=Paenibacillus ginsengarvi TaxID=400777 RepID=A0A3B0CBJ3_9BACL|nr:metallophosphoesterase [Paenibacillus ginsengarvi]RKN82071.1 metallophosphoesterase [Paenibacillus ginsengarvi]